MNRRSWPLLVAVALAVFASVDIARAETQVADGQKLNPPASGVVHWTRRSVDSTGTTAGRVDSAVIVYPARIPGTPSLVGGIYRADTSSRAFSMTSDGCLLTSETSPAWGLNTTFWVVSNVTLNAGNGFLSGFYPVSPFHKLQLQVSWTDSAKVSATIDSTVFEIFPVGKISQTADGFDHYMKLDYGVTGTANSDTAFVGYCVGNVNSAFAQTGGKFDIHIPNRINRVGSVGGSLAIYNVSFPLATRQGTDLQADIIGFYIVNRSLGAAAAATNLHNLNISLVAKAN